MSFTENFINGITIFEPKFTLIIGDSFLSPITNNCFHANGIFTEFIQDNQSFSVYGVIRGLHYQREPLRRPN